MKTLTKKTQTEVLIIHTWNLLGSLVLTVSAVFHTGSKTQQHRGEVWLHTEDPGLWFGQNGCHRPPYDAICGHSLLPSPWSHPGHGLPGQWWVEESSFWPMRSSWAAAWPGLLHGPSPHVMFLLQHLPVTVAHTGTQSHTCIPTPSSWKGHTQGGFGMLDIGAFRKLPGWSLQFPAVL